MSGLDLQILVSDSACLDSPGSFIDVFWSQRLGADRLQQLFVDNSGSDHVPGASCRQQVLLLDTELDQCVLVLQDSL